MASRLLFTLFLLPLNVLAQEMPLWLQGAPGVMKTPSASTHEFVSKRGGKSVISPVKEPTLTVFKARGNNTAKTIIVAPGGGFAFLSAVNEGSAVCEFLADRGITGVLLKYRTPTRDEDVPHAMPVADAGQAVAWVRQHSAEWGGHKDGVGLMGFSAGGKTLAHAFCDRAPTAGALPAEQRPDFGVMIYGGGFIEQPKDAPARLMKGFSVPADAGPMFIACAGDDGSNPVASTLLYLAFKQQGIPCELHLYSAGGHGFGMRRNGQPINDWPTRVVEWLSAMK